MVAAIRAVKLDELREKREEAELTNELRSGERGKQAQRELWDVVARCPPTDRLENQPTGRLNSLFTASWPLSCR